MVQPTLNGSQNIMQVFSPKSSGFTYLGLLFFIVIMGNSLLMATTLWSFIQYRENERQLIFIGHQFREAIRLYYEHTPGTVKRYPQSLEDLLQDNRFINTQRYLRRIYMDPITLSNNWGLVTSPDGGVMGVFSTSNLKPAKTGNFDIHDQFADGLQSYSDWKFIYLPKN